MRPKLDEGQLLLLTKKHLIFVSRFVVAHLTVTEVKLVFSHIACSPEAAWEEMHNKKSTSYEMLILFSNSTASRNFNMGLLRIPFLCGLRLAKTILCLRASPGLRFSPRSPLTFLMSIATWPGSYQDCQIKKTPFQVSLSKPKEIRYAIKSLFCDA